MPTKPDSSRPARRPVVEVEGEPHDVELGEPGNELVRELGTRPVVVDDRGDVLARSHARRLVEQFALVVVEQAAVAEQVGVDVGVRAGDGIGHAEILPKWTHRYPGHEGYRSPGPRGRRAIRCAGGIMRVHVVGIIGAALTLTAAALAAPVSHAAVARAGSGPWHLVDGSGKARAGAPAVWENSKHVATVLWYRQDGPGSFTYQTITVSAKGKPAATSTDAFAGQHWDSLYFAPTLLSSGGKPLVVFSGGKGSSGFYSHGCVYGAQSGTNPWTLQNWSLSADCVNPNPAAAENGSATLLAAWPSSPGVRYRIGTSPTAPASGTDSQININGATAAKVGAADDIAGTGHFYVAWTQANSSKDGLYVKDVTANGATVKVPTTGTNSTNHAGLGGEQSGDGEPEHARAASTSPRAPTERRAACSCGASARPRRCRCRRRRTPSARRCRPGRQDGCGSRGSTAQTNKVSIVRTNKNVTRFGSVQTFATPCVANDRARDQRRIVGPCRCRDRLRRSTSAASRSYVYATQMLVPLSVSLSPQSVKNTAAHDVTVTVRDVGDPVAHATVHYGTQHPTTNSSGRATIHIAKGTSTGAKHVSVTATDYRSGSATLHVTH